MRVHLDGGMRRRWQMVGKRFFLDPKEFAETVKFVEERYRKACPILLGNVADERQEKAQLKELKVLKWAFFKLPPLTKLKHRQPGVICVELAIDLEILQKKKKKKKKSQNILQSTSTIRE